MSQKSHSIFKKTHNYRFMKQFKTFGAPKLEAFWGKMPAWGEAFTYFSV